MKMFIICIKDMFNVLNTTSKKRCFRKALAQLSFVTIIGTITAPIIWSIFYLRRYKIFDKLKVPIEDYTTNIPLHKSKVYLNWFDYILFYTGIKLTLYVKNYQNFLKNDMVINHILLNGFYLVQ